MPLVFRQLTRLVIHFTSQDKALYADTKNAAHVHMPIRCMQIKR